jgi:hypothetical protein
MFAEYHTTIRGKQHHFEPENGQFPLQFVRAKTATLLKEHEPVTRIHKKRRFAHLIQTHGYIQTNRDCREKKLSGAEQKVIDTNGIGRLIGAL